MHVRGGGGGTYWPGQFDHARVNTHINTGGTVQQGTFRVDMDQVPALITKYEEARDKLSGVASKAYYLQATAPPGNDEVSKHLADALGKMATGSPGCLLAAVNDGIERLNTQINQLEEARASYQSSDETATPKLT